MKYLNLFLWSLRAAQFCPALAEDPALIQKDASVEVRVLGLLGRCLLPYTLAR